MDGHQRQREESARMIEEALFTLMKEKEYAQITVSEIVSRADVARRTFYRLYREKDEVLRRYFGKLCQKYCQSVPVLNGYQIRQISAEFFTFWYGYRDFLLLLQKCRLDHMLYYEIGRASAQVVNSRMGRSEQENAEEIGLFADYSTGGFILLLQRWVRTGMQGSPEEYAQAVSRALLKFGLRQL